MKSLAANKNEVNILAAHLDYLGFFYVGSAVDTFCKLVIPESEMSSQYGESNSYSAFKICSNNLASFSS